jgi:hypothetical protein
VRKERESRVDNKMSFEIKSTIFPSCLYLECDDLSSLFSSRSSAVGDKEFRVT